MVLRPLHMPSASDAGLPFGNCPGNAATVSWLQVSFLQNCRSLRAPKGHRRGADDSERELAYSLRSYLQ